MVDSDRIPLETPEEFLESEIRDLEKNTLNSGWLWVSALVGLLVLAGAAFLITTWDREGQKDRTFAFTPETIQLTEPLSTVHGFPTFRWMPMDAAATYIVLVKPDFMDEVALLRPVRETYLQPSESESINFSPGRYTWSVEARSAKGTLIGYGDASFEIVASSR